MTGSTRRSERPAGRGTHTHMCADDAVMHSLMIQSTGDATATLVRSPTWAVNATSMDSWLACSCSVWFGIMYMSSQVALMLLFVFGTPELTAVSVGRLQVLLTLGVSTR